MPLQVRRGTNAQRQAMTEPLASGELLYTTDTGTLYIGNGSTLGGVAVANLSSQDVRDLSAALFTSGTHSGISFDYDSEAGTIDAIVDPDLSNYQGVIRASAFSGSLVADDSGLLVDALNSSINLDGTVKGDIIPDQSEIYDIGSSSRKFKDLYLSGSSLFLGDATITATGSVVNLPSGSTVGGVAIGTGSEIVGSGVVEGSNYQINIVSDDSTILLDSATGEHFGLFKGSFFANDSSQIIDGDTGRITASVEGNLFGSVIGQDLTLLIDSTTNEHFGLFKGSFFANDSSQIIDGDTGIVSGTFEGNLFGSVIGQDLTLLIDSTTNEHFGLFKGSFFGEDSTQIIDGHSGVVTGLFQGNLIGNVEGDLTGRINATGNLTGNVIGNLTGNVLGDINGNHFGNTFGELIGNTTGNHVGTVFGDVKGSVFGDDSSIIVDAVDNSLFCNDITISGEIVVTNPTIDVVNSDPTLNAKIRRFVPEGGNHTDVFAITEGSYASGSNLYLSRGTLTSPTTVTVGDTLNSDISFAHDGNDFTITAAVVAAVDPYGTVSAGAVPGLIGLYTINDGNIANRKGIIIDSIGWTSINKPTSQAQATLDVNGFAKLAILSSAPASPADGMIAIADGDSVSGWDPLGIGAPAKQQTVVYLGGGWRQIAVEP